jgi:Cu+-exporting ATPase
MGEPKVSDIVPLPGDGTEETLLILAASVERGSEHPLGKAIVSEAEHRGMSLVPVKEFKMTGGSGVEAYVEGIKVRIGKPNWFESMGLDASRVRNTLEQLQNQGKTVMVVFQDDHCEGLIAVSDTLKPDSKAAISRLHDAGLEVMMLTGDNEQTARSIARQLDLDDVLAEVYPAEKAEKISELQSRRLKVAMVGDGINDAPALAQSDVGIAIGSGADVAIESADVILVSGSLLGVSEAIRLSRATLKTIRQNLFWAFFYNLLLIPVAAGALYPFESLPHFVRQLHPILAALAMAFSSVSVVSNSLRLYTAKLQMKPVNSAAA